MCEYIEVEGQEVEHYTYILTDNEKAAGEQESRVRIDVNNGAIWSGKTKALIILMPHYDNDKPTVINVGLDNKEIDKAINIVDGTFRDIDTYKKQAERLQQQVDRLEIELEKAREDSIYGNS
jgi:hypothetical protein